MLNSSGTCQRNDVVQRAVLIAHGHPSRCGAALPIIAEPPCGCNAAANKISADAPVLDSESPISAACAITCAAGASRATAPRTLVMLHGWMDVSASFQFVVDALGEDWRVVAPDWRGYGLTDRAPRRLLLVPGLPGRPRSHARSLSPRSRSPGRPQHGRQRRLAVRRRSPGARARGGQPRRIRPARRPMRPRRPAASRNGSTNCAVARPCATTPMPVKSRLASRSNNRRLRPERAAFLAQHWARPSADGRWESWRAIRRIGSSIRPCIARRGAGLLAHASRVRCCGCVLKQTDVLRHVARVTRRRIARGRDAGAPLIATCEERVIDDAGHMLHHDRPEAVARAIADFVGEES